MDWSKERDKQIIDFFNSVKKPGDIVNRIKDDPDYLRSSKRAYGIRPSLAEEIIKTRNSLQGKKFSSVKEIDAIKGIGEDTLHDIYYSLAPSTQFFPVLLFPVRLETRFIKNELLIRIYPDVPLINNHDPRITENEFDLTEKFHKEFDKAESEEKRISAWRGLVEKVGSLRASYLKSLDLTNLDTIKIKKDDWDHSPFFQFLPDHFLINIYRGTELSYSERGKSIPSKVPILSHPNNIVAREDSLFDDDSRWVSDFNTAADIGLAVRIQLEKDKKPPFSKVVAIGMQKNSDPFTIGKKLEDLFSAHKYSSGFSFLSYGTPTNNTGDVKSGYTWKEDSSSDQFDIEYRERPITEDDCCGRTFSESLGINARVFQNVVNADIPNETGNEDINTIVWPALGNSFLTLYLNNKTGPKERWLLWSHFRKCVRARGALPSIRIGKQPYGILPVTSIAAWESSPKDYNELTGPIITNLKDIDKNILDPRKLDKFKNPAVWDLKDVSGFYNGFHKILLLLHNRWLQIALDHNLVPRVGKSGDSDEELMKILSMQPASIDTKIRALVDDRFVSRLMTYMGIDLLLEEMPNVGSNDDVLKIWGRDLYETQSDARELLSDIAIAAGLSPEQLLNSGILNLFGWDESSDLPTSLVHKDGASGSLEYFEEFIGTNTIPGSNDTMPLFYDIMRAALQYQQLPDESLRLKDHKYKIEFLKSTGFEKFKIVKIHVKPGSTIEKDDLLITIGGTSNTIGASKGILAEKSGIIVEIKIKEGDTITKDQILIVYLAHVYADYEIYKSIEALYSTKPQEIEALLHDALDLQTHRLDAWFTSFAAQRLFAMRSGKEYKEGLYVGAYGWLEDLSPDVQNLADEPGGYIHAYSLPQAAAGAVLRNAHLTQKNNEEGYPYAINLTSKRVRKAWRLIDGLREGQELGALLGYHFERGLHESGLDIYIDDFRKLYPIDKRDYIDNGPGTFNNANHEAEKPAETITVRNVVDGLSLVRDWSGGHNDNDWFSNKEWVQNGDKQEIKEKLNDLVDTLDALTDLLLYESTYHAVQGNYERSAAAIDAMSSKSMIEEPHSIQTPPSGVPFTQRFCFILDHKTDSFTGYREQAEPVLAHWFNQILGDMSKIGCTATIFTDSEKATKMLDLNQATQQELKDVPEIGETLARQIVEDRANGKFRNVMELTRIDGVGDAKVTELAGLVYVKEPHDILLSDLYIGPLDFLYLCNVTPEAVTSSIGYKNPQPGDRIAGETEIEQRIKYFVRKKNMLYPETHIEIDFWKAPPGVDRNMGEALELGRYILKFIQQSTYLDPLHFHTPEQIANDQFEQAYTFDIDELRTRAGRSLQQLTDLCNNHRLHDQNDMDILFVISRCNIEGSIPPSPLRNDLPGRRESVKKIIERKIAESQALLDQADSKIDAANSTVSDPENAVEQGTLEQKAVELLIQAMKALFGKNFVVLPALQHGQTDEIKNAAEQNILPGPLDGARIELWLQQAAVTHKALDNYETTMMIKDAWNSTRVSDNTDHTKINISHTGKTNLNVLQLPCNDKRPWFGLSDEEVYNNLTEEEAGEIKKQISEDGRERGVLSLVYASPGTVDFSNNITGFFIDEWSEWIPAPVRQTGVSFHYDSPDSQAPQALLLAVPPVWSEEHQPWTFEALRDIVNSTIDLAKIRAVDSDAFNSKAGQFFPMTILPPNLSRPEWDRDTVLPGLSELLEERQDQHVDFRLFPKGTGFEDKTFAGFTFTSSGQAVVKEEMNVKNKFLVIPKDDGITITSQRSYDRLEMYLAKDSNLNFSEGSSKLRITCKDKDDQVVGESVIHVSSTSRWENLVAYNFVKVEISGNEDIRLYEFRTRIVNGGS